ncbi:pre-coat protein [Vernonia crinkle virus]|uniref:Protein V2 n=1 Tax=Vernonia crinkle virus TaxID=1925153 RepID=A0A1L4AB01_9GEMI|nr:pre-coat protein [Vernonia crinkle virus]API65467.1 pre-coat protein [Vernonia crinkle virus]API65474.1 pre-coat protein [Vernonia crinkle virus]
MFDPLLNPFPRSYHGFRIMLAVKYLQICQEKYSNGTKGHTYLQELIRILRRSDFNEASDQYTDFITVFGEQSPTEAELRQPSFCEAHFSLCPKCSGPMAKQAHVQEAQDIPNVSFVGRSPGL